MTNKQHADDNDAHLLSGAYVLHAVTPTEVKAMERAMDRSEDLRSEVAELTDTAVLLGLSVPSVEPTAEFRARLLALVDATPQLAPLPSSERASDREFAPVTGVVPATIAQGNHVAGAGWADAALSGSRRRRATTPQRQWMRRPSVLLAAAAAVVVLFGGGVIAEQAVFPSSTESTTQAEAFAALTSARDVHHASTTVTGGGTAIVYWSKSRNASAVVLTGDVTVPSGKVLQLWLLKRPTVVSAGLFTPATGHSYEMMQGDLSNTDGIGITVEPAGGSKQPTTPEIAVVTT